MDPTYGTELPWKITRPSDELKQLLIEAHFTIGLGMRDMVDVYPPLGWKMETGSLMNTIRDEQGLPRFIDFFGKGSNTAQFCQVRPLKEVQEELAKLRKKTVLTTGLDFGRFMELVYEHPGWKAQSILSRMRREGAFISPKPRRRPQPESFVLPWYAVTTLRAPFLPATKVRRVG